MIDIHNKFLFIHIPRTNGSDFCNKYYNSFLSESVPEGDFIDYYVGNPCLRKHFRYSEYLTHFNGLKLNQFKKVVAVRNPFDLMVSHYWMRLEKEDKWLKRFNINSFSDFVKFLANSEQQGITSEIRLHSFVDQCHDLEIIRYETYDLQAKDILVQFSEGMPNYIDQEDRCVRFNENELLKEYAVRYKRKNAGLRPLDYRRMYDSYTKDAVAKLFHWDLKTFDYEF